MAYSEEQKAGALVKLALNGNDYEKTAAEVGVSERQLYRWAGGQNIKRAKKVSKKANVSDDKPPDVLTALDDHLPDLTVADMLEATIKRLLMLIPARMSGDDWSRALGILMDKWLILQGQPNQRVDILTRMLEQLPDSEYDNIIEEAKRVLSEARGGDFGSESDEA